MDITAMLIEAGRLYQSGQFAQAEALGLRVLAAQSNQPDALRLLGLVALRSGRPQSAFELLNRALAADDSAISHCALADAYWNVGQLDLAERHATRALELHPDYGDALMILGIARGLAGRTKQAEDALRRVIAQRPSYPPALTMLGNVQLTCGRADLAIETYRQSLAIDPSNHIAHDNLLMAMNLAIGDDAQALFDEHVRWGQRHASSIERTHQPPPRNPATDRKLRVGYISPDFREHAVAYFFEPLLEAHDRERFAITLYANVRFEDAVSQRLRSMAYRWRLIAGMTDDQVARQIRADEIDVLIDLAGHSSDNRLLVLARRPAPVQMSYLGYPNTTGLRACDYVITDVYQDPPGTEAFHTEKLIRLPRTMHCYRPSDRAPDVRVDATYAGPLRLGSFNRLEKLTPATLNLWLPLLRAVPDATLTVKSPAMADADTRAGLIARFVAGGVEESRLIQRPRDGSLADHIARYHEIDVALDSYPYNGTTTTCEALWMGVPVLTMQGPTRVTRTTPGILRSTGLDELIAESPEQFVRTGTSLASNRAHLHELRATMRDRMRASPLMDATSLARAVEQAFRDRTR